MTDTLLDDLNAAVGMVPSIPRVEFAPGLPADADRWLMKKHANGAVHEPATIAAFLAARKWRDCRTVFDVGAGFGYFSLLCRQVFPDAEITAFEMHPASYPSLRANVRPAVRCVKAAVSDVFRKDVMIWLSGFNIFEEPEGGWSALQNDPAAMKPRGLNNSGRGFTRVDFITLDDYCRTAALPDVIKIDVEAYQAKAVLGGVETFRASKPIVIIELHDPEKVHRLGTTNVETVRPFYDMGYQGFWCGNFRTPDARFERVERMTEAHERLSLMVFVPA